MVISNKNDTSFDNRVAVLNEEIKNISEEKKWQARTILSQLSYKFPMIEKVFIITGDVAQDMAHNEPRINPASNQIMSGSDFDFIIILGEKATKRNIQEIETTLMFAEDIIQAERFGRCEVDFDVLKVSDLEKLNLNDAKDLKLGKNILQSYLIDGNEALLKKAKKILERIGMVKQVEELTKIAYENRRKKASKLKRKDAEEWTASDVEFFFGTFEAFMEVKEQDLIGYNADKNKKNRYVVKGLLGKNSVNILTVERTFELLEHSI